MTVVKKGGLIILGTLCVVLVGRLLLLDVGVDNVQGSLSYAALTIFALLSGAILTPIVAFLAHFLSDSLTYTTVWWTWIVADGVFGLMLGLIATRLNLLKQPITLQRAIQFNIWQGIANILVWGVIAPLGDALVYKSDWLYVLNQGLTAAGLNFLVIGIFGTAFIYGYHFFKNKA
ncbi:ECF-type riboflavin transporter substrate-binding protein [Weissella ceti]|uniref:ECF-type riboflavin transporter substrate-binding protein n=1 Tax=Weissella ceti TaxID=759620 RepID=A0ABT3E2W9_9LACO|nr:ECF-type riboflavin transporter substrate-binding protein [Weissella ceti]MCW0952599.1 ECF-type riboflavin transporter substrate-binding protein [Weissella ceti]QVK11738.1 ECF-type riboflavin transporter substrate-binding protein [Weissella ceti]